MADNNPFILGIDVGGTSTGVGIVTALGKLEESVTIPTEAGSGPRDVVRRIGSAAKDLMKRHDGKVALAGAGAPGPLDIRTGVVIEMPNLGWKDVPLRVMLEEELGLVTHLDNDANSAAFGEYWVGAGMGARLLVCFTLGTGVGGGIVVDGEVLRGVSGAAAEFGHMLVETGGRRCKCGKHGCLEAYASATAIAARARERLEAKESSVLRDLAGGDSSLVTSKLVSEAALAGDGLAREIIEETARYLAVGVSNVMNLLNPDVVVIGGGVIGAGDLLLDPLREFVRELTFEVHFRDARIVAAALGSEAGIVGAAGIALVWERGR
jgi:glucokinase